MQRSIASGMLFVSLIRSGTTSKSSRKGEAPGHLTVGAVNQGLQDRAPQQLWFTVVVVKFGTLTGTIVEHFGSTVLPRLFTKVVVVRPIASQCKDTMTVTKPITLRAPGNPPDAAAISTYTRRCFSRFFSSMLQRYQHGAAAV